MKIENLTVKTVNTEKLIEFLAVQLNENEKNQRNSNRKRNGNNR